MTNRKKHDIRQHRFQRQMGEGRKEAEGTVATETERKGKRGQKKEWDGRERESINRNKDKGQWQDSEDSQGDRKMRGQRQKPK